MLYYPLYNHVFHNVVSLTPSLLVNDSDLMIHKSSINIYYSLNVWFQAGCVWWCANNMYLNI